MSARAKRITGTAIPDRWMAEIFYRDDTPAMTVAFEEIEDLDEIVELGLDWNLIERIVITLNRPTLKP
jgi:hypothetical protein